jgi:HTH-type transcriptional regulator, fmd operon transcriptional regulator
LVSKSDDEAEREDSCLLTDRQIEVLRLRFQGLSQQEVAGTLGTTRSNVSILEKRAHQNISRAKRTLEMWKEIQAPISLKIPAGTDIFDVPSMIFKAADEKAIQLPVNSLEVIDQLRAKAPKLFKKRALLEDVRVYVTGNGELLAEDLKGD